MSTSISLSKSMSGRVACLALTLALLVLTKSDILAPWSELNIQDSWSYRSQITHRMAFGAFWRTFHNDRKISPGWWGGRGVHAHPLTLQYSYHHVQSCSVRSSWVGRDTPCFICTNQCCGSMTFLCGFWIRGFMLLTNGSGFGSGPCCFRSWLTFNTPTKI